MATVTVHVDGQAFDVEVDDPATSWRATIEAGTKEAAQKIAVHLDAIQRPLRSEEALLRKIIKEAKGV